MTKSNPTKTKQEFAKQTLLINLCDIKQGIMAKFSKEEQKQRIDHAKQLYCKGFDCETIADIIRDVSATTVKRWADENEFEKSKRSQVIALSEIRNSILESYADLLDGKKPKIKPDEAAKYATAFEKFSSKKQVLMYMYEAFELLTEEFQKDIQTGKSRAIKEIALTDLQKLRTKMNTVITNLNNEVLGNE